MTSTPLPSPGTRLDEIVTAFLLAEERGEQPEPAVWLARHPDLAEELSSFFATRARVERVAAPLRAAAVVGQTIGFVEAADNLGSVGYFGDYELVAEIARGGMGVVYKARQTSLNRMVALKMILAGHLASEGDVRRFLHEAESAANLDHPNIVPIYEIGEHHGQHYFSMKLIEGGSLNHRLQEFRADIRGAVRLLVQVARGVHHAHQRGILHRDLKPGNILLEVDGQPRVADFGLAKRTQGQDAGLTQSGAVLGTPNYMSPEQASGAKDLSTASDVYSLGAILYELLTGEPPHKSDSVAETIRRSCAEEPRKPREIEPEVDRDLETICLKCLRQEPIGRYRSAEALAEELERWLEGKPILARPVGGPERAWRWCRRNPALAGLMAAIAASLLLGTAISTHFATTAANFASTATERADRLQRLNYVSQMNLAQRAWEEGQIGRLHDILASQRPENTANTDLRGLEWHYWNNLSHAELYSIPVQAPFGRVSPVLFSADNKRLFGSSEGCLKVWDVATGRETRSLPGFRFGISALALHPDGLRLATGTLDRLVQVWEIETGRELVRTQAAGAVESLAFSPDGRLLASGHQDFKALILDAESGKILHTLPGDGWAGAVAFSPDGKHLARAQGALIDPVKFVRFPGEVSIWDASTGKHVRTFKSKRGVVTGIFYDSGGTRLYTTHADGSLAFRNTDESDSEERMAPVFSRGAYLVKASGCRIWNCAEPGAGLSEREAPSAPSDTELFLQQGGLVKRNSTMLDLTNSPVIHVWHVTLGQGGGILHGREDDHPKLRGHSRTIRKLAWSSDELRAASAAEDGTIKVWDTGRDRVPEAISLVLKSAPACAAVSTSDGDRIVTADIDGNLTVAPADGRGEPVTYSNDFPAPARLAMRPGKDEAALVNGKRHGWTTPAEICLFDLRTEKFTRRKVEHVGNLLAIAYSPDGKILATGDGGYHAVKEGGPTGWVKGEIKLWNADSFTALATLRGHEQGVLTLAWSADGRRLASGGHDGTVRVWDFANRTEALSDQFKHQGPVNAVAFDADRSLASGGDDKEILIWDLATGKPKGTLDGHFDAVTCLAFAGEGTRLLSGSMDLTTRIWDTWTWGETTVFRSSGSWMTFDPGTCRLANFIPGAQRLQIRRLK